MPFDPQLENNTTKALVNTLQHGGPAVLSSFLSVIDPGIDPGHSQHAKIRLQTDPSFLSDVDERWLVSITASPTIIQDGGHEEAHEKGLPDALVYSLPHLGIIIESKVAAALSEAQLGRHVASAGWADFRRRDTTWAEIYTALGDGPWLNPRDRFLVEQFRQYLEMVTLTPFTGFTGLDFDFFVTLDDDYRPVIRKKLLQFGQMLYDALPSRFRKRYDEGPYVGRTALRGGLWLGLRPVQDKKDAFRHCNFTIELDGSALSFNAVIRDGKATDKRKPIGVLYKRLSRDIKPFMEYLDALGSDFSLRVFSRTGHAGGQILPGSEKWEPQYVQRLDCLIPESAPMILGLLRSIRYPGIHIRRELPRGEVLRLSADELLREGVGALHRLRPALSFLEGGKLVRSARRGIGQMRLAPAVRVSGPSCEKAPAVAHVPEER